MHVYPNTDMAERAEMNDIASGIILKQMDYRDYDVILTVLTKEYGKLSFIASGIRKMTSRNAGSSLPYTKAEIHFRYDDKKTMFRLQTIRTKKMYRNVHSDLLLSNAAGIMMEASDALTLQGLQSDSWKETFDLLERAMDLLEEKKDPTTVVSLFLVEIMNLFGIGADVDECVRDGSQKVSAISVKDGGFLCETCARFSGIQLSLPTDLKRFRLLVKGGLKHFDLIESAGGAEANDLRILVQMIEMHSGITIRAYSLFDRLFLR